MTSSWPVTEVTTEVETDAFDFSSTAVVVVVAVAVDVEAAMVDRIICRWVARQASFIILLYV